MSGGKGEKIQVDTVGFSSKHGSSALVKRFEVILMMGANMVHTTRGYMCKYVNIAYGTWMCTVEGIFWNVLFYETRGKTTLFVPPQALTSTGKISHRHMHTPPLKTTVVQQAHLRHVLPLVSSSLPAGHGPEHAVSCNPPLSPNVPAGHSIATPSWQYRPFGQSASAVLPAADVPPME